jgi:transcriptional regulator with XRE-family HTH domain
MKSLIELRGELGMSQRDMALFLDINRSQLSMAELLQRNLPREALDKVHKIQKELDLRSRKKNVAWTLGDKDRAELIKWLDAQIKECNFQLEVARRELKKVDSELADAGKSFEKLTQLTEVAKERGERPHALLRRNLSRGSEKLSSTLLQKRIDLRVQYASYKAHAAELEKIKKEWI